MKNTRAFVHIHGQQQWCIDITNEILAGHFDQFGEIICCGIKNKLFGDKKATYINNAKKRSEIENHLGTEYGILIFNCFNGFNPDLFCALAGLIKAPGFIILITPDITHWPHYVDPDYAKFCSYPYRPQNIKGRYVTYLIHKLTQHSSSKDFFTLAQNSSNKEQLNIIKTYSYKLFKENTSITYKLIIPSLKQKNIIASLGKLITARNDGIITIYGNRGRGKSTAIGMALRYLVKTPDIPELNISVVSQNKSNVIPIFKQLEEIESDCKNNCLVNYFPPDEFLRQKPDCNVLIIDEAAAISLGILKQLIASTPKIVIASTIDGYEGTGRGLWTKLQTHLSRIDCSIDSFELTSPQRWENNDAVENFIVETFLLQKKTQANNDNLSPCDQKNRQLSIEKIDRDALSHDTGKVHQLFQLLIQAHYRTTPDDLRYILDAPDVELWVAKTTNNIRAVLMVCDESIVGSDLGKEIWLGKRRLTGHLIPQALSSQSGFRQATCYSYKRIIRIAVEEKYRRKGIASKLIDNFTDSIKNPNQSTDFIGVSYGFEPSVYKFWQNLDFKPIRIGHRENTRSGLRSIIMLKPISANAKIFCGQLENNFKRNLKFDITHTKNKIPNSEMFLNDFGNLSKNQQQDRLDIYTFAFGNRQYSNCQRSLHEFAVYCLNTQSLRKKINQKQIDLISLKVLQDIDWAESSNVLTLNGKKQMIAELRAVYSILYNAVWGNKS